MGKTPGDAQKSAVNQLNNKVKNEVQQNQNQTAQKQRDYGQKTDHGRKQPQ
jgi:Bacterial protein of unknown function (DUF922)